MIAIFIEMITGGCILKNESVAVYMVLGLPCKHLSKVLFVQMFNVLTFFFFPLFYLDEKMWAVLLDMIAFNHWL